jgi:membrane associated rhomboid family serine protease
MLEATLIHYALIPVRYTDPQLALSIGLDPANFMPMLTDMFLHGGWMHLIFNMWFLWIFGAAMEARFGRLGFLALYVMGGITANIVHIATHPYSTEPVIGASGAVAAIIAAYAVTYPWERVLTIVPLGFIPLFIPAPAILFALVWFGLQLLQGSSELASPGMAASVAWWAHIGGFLFGALVAMVAHQTPAPVPAPVPRPVPARMPITVWRHTSGWRVPDVRRHFPRD